MEAEERLRAALADRYQIEREIGSGGMATVYLAADLKHDRKVALKILKPELAAAMGTERFLREIKTAANLAHPHILPLFDSGEADGFLFYVMPYVKGESLRSRLERESQLPVEDAVQIACEIADALSYAHEEGIIHRDVKPANILLEAGHAVLADFGVAHAVAEAKDDRITQTGVSLGTPAYMSPEQAAGEHDLETRSDQYSLGCVLYEMLSGDPPFTGSSRRVVLARQVNERLPSLAVVRPDLPLALVRAVEKALAKAPADRYRTAAGLLTALTESTRAASGVGRLGKVGGRRKRWVAGLLTAAVAVAGAYWVFGSRAPLDPNLLVVFPLDVSGDLTPDETGRGEDNAYLIWSALEGRGSLGWINALSLVDEPEKVSRISARARRALARAQGAGLYLHGRLIFSADSARALLSLHQVSGDSVVARADTAAPRTEATMLGVYGVSQLLLALLPEETVDVSAVTGRDAQAVQIFVQAERHFYAGRFRAAFDHYVRAVRQDSDFALAAVKGAQAASWLHRSEDAQGLIANALEHRESLTPKQEHFARGLAAFFAYQADSAVYHFERAIEIDPEWSEAWTGLGEVYTHLLPRNAPQDSLAQDAFMRVYGLTNHSAPALFHLVEFAVREGDLSRASGLLREYRDSNPDTAGYALEKLSLMLRCAEGVPSEREWRDHVLRSVDGTLEAARSMAVGGSLPDCALAGYRSVLAHDTSAMENWRYAAAVGLQSMFVATGQAEELVSFMDTVSVYRTSLRHHFIVDALAGAPVAPLAEADAEALRGVFTGAGNVRIWFLGIWDAHRGRLEEARMLRDILVERTQEPVPDPRQTRLMAASLRAHVALAEGDSTEAVELLDELSPDARRGSLYYPWESLGLERLMLARLLMARGRYADAYREATVFDSPGAANLIFSIFLPASLELRLEAAQELGDESAADKMESRLSALKR